jgi:translation initiation factor IF-3
VIGANGEQLGILKLNQHVRLRKTQRLTSSLLLKPASRLCARSWTSENSAMSRKKKMKDQKKHQHAQKVKEIKFRLNIDAHDYAFKIKHGHDFLAEGCKLKVTLTFKGREMAHTEMGYELINRITEDLKESGVLESPAKLLGKNICVAFNPKSAH